MTMPQEMPDIEICVCGCFRDNHDPITTRCRYCPGDDCLGYTYDEEAALMPFFTEEDWPLPSSPEEPTP